jgi:cyanate permease
MDENALGFIAIAFFGLISLACFALFIWSIVWSYNDAESRGKSGCAVALLVALVSWPLGLLIWYVARPEHKRLD